jgi:hypothetical protein
MSHLSTLGQFMCGEFDNREQAIENPPWFVHLRLWQRPVNLFRADSFTVFAEQANVLKLDQPYRQRFMRLQPAENGMTVQYYMLKNPAQVKGAGQNPGLLETIREEDLDRLPGCFLNVSVQESDHGFRFIASQPSDCLCRFSFQGSTIQVALGFEAASDQFRSYDKGIDPDTDRPIWGAILGAYEFTKRQQF